MFTSSLAAHVSGDEAVSRPTLMSSDPDCVITPPQSELRDELTVILLCFLAGFFTLRVFPVRRRRVKAAPLPASNDTWSKDSGVSLPPVATWPDTFLTGLQSLAVQLSAGLIQRLHKADQDKPQPAPAPEGLAGFPHEITAEIARCLPLHDFASVSAAGSACWQRFGLSADAWHLLANDYGIDMRLDAGLGGGASSTTAASGSDLREAFRCRHFRIDGHDLISLVDSAPGVGGMGHAAILTEAAHVVRGLMPRDGAECLEMICEVTERALQAHNPANKEAASAAARFLSAVRLRSEPRVDLPPDVVSVAQLERLESAYSSALQLQALMDVAMDQSFEEMEISSERSEASTTPPSTSPRLPIVVPGTEQATLDVSAGPAARSCQLMSPPCMERLADAALEDMHEVQRHSELDALLEKLRLSVE
jgi:hypothetical protein